MKSNNITDRGLMKINTKRLWDHIMELGRIGSGADGSVTRFPFTPEDKSAETWKETERAI